MDRISIRGARMHNLKNVDVDLPRDRLIVVTGLSGSGKSSLAFDTLYAEGQRRYVETLSPHARQFLDRMAKPDVDSIEGLSPTISIEQRPAPRNPRSTVGTLTEIQDFLRLLYARIGAAHCWLCGERITSQSIQEMVDRTLELPEGTRFSVLAPVLRDRAGEFPGAFRDELEELRRQGYLRATLDGELVDLGELLERAAGEGKGKGKAKAPAKPQAKTKKTSAASDERHTLEVYVDRLAIKQPLDGMRQRLTDSIELAARLADGRVKVSPVDGADLVYSEHCACITCGTTFPSIEPQLFSFNNPYGACPECDGIGARLFFDPERVVPDPELSLREGAIEPWERRNSAYYQAQLAALATRLGFDLLTPWRELPESVRALILHGTGHGGAAHDVELSVERNGARQTLTKEFEGVLPSLERRLAEYERRRRELAAARSASSSGGGEGIEAAYEEFHRYMNQSACTGCGGTRLRREARHVFVGGKALHELTALPVKETLRFFESLELGRREREVAERILREVTERLRFLVNVGLDYLSLERTSATLSGGEAQRIRLATQIGAPLVGVTYVLDEPSIGLHARDNGRLISTLKALRDRGNTVVVVEHDEATIRAADHVVDMGPRAGVHGGRVVASGSPEQLMAAPGSLTGDYLAGRERVPVPRRRAPRGKWLELRGARAHNLRGVSARFPLGLFTCVTGVSGSGKSTLVIDTLLPALKTRRGAASSSGSGSSGSGGGDYDALEGTRFVERVIDIDQSPIGRTPRSNPATYTGVLAHVRDLFAGLPDSKARGYRAGRYSFNVKGGRCETCQGDGILRIEMHFLPDVFVECEACRGRRYNRETLEVRYKGASIADVLDMTVAEATEFLAHIPKARTKLETLRDVGLGYLTLGQAATTLSGGEAQRIKLARELAKKNTTGTVYILDEPTTGLHFDDIRQLLVVLGRLVDAGHTVIVIEHDLDVIKSADWVVDLGPEGGDGGGVVVAQGTPEEVARVEASHTGRYLRAMLSGRRPDERLTGHASSAG